MGTTGQSITLANSIIGVGILAMPFCFQQCGVLLATLILLSMGLVSRLCCYFLLKSALLARRRNFEFLAFHVFGPAGKLAVEVGIIGFLMGTCIAYFVVVGDLGPQIIAKMFNINQSDILRTSIMVLVSLVCVLPLGLLRNVDSLSNVSAATIGFYFCLVLKVITEAASQLFSNDWHNRVEMWKPAGVLQCVPIFSMALFCQTQLFEIFESLPNLSLEKMNVVTKNAINICTAVYFTLGLFGYVAFSAQEISGNILMSLSPTMASDVIKLGFVMSLACSFPLIIFPCRASLYSFLYKKVHSSQHDHIINHSIPETSFRCITVSIIAVSLFISLLIPNIELVLGLVGSTIGVMVCVVFPTACFLNLTFKNTNERLLAKGALILGLLIMVLGTYANLEAAENKLPIDRYDEQTITQERIDKIVEDFFEKMDKSDDKGMINKPLEKNGDTQQVDSKEVKDSEVQPPNPVPPGPQSNEKVKEVAEPMKEDKARDRNKSPIEEVDKLSESHPKNLKGKLNGAKVVNGEKKIENMNVEKPKEMKPESTVKLDKSQQKIDMIKQQQLIETIKQHGEEQKELIKEQKEILQEILKTKDEMQQNKKDVDSNEAKIIAVESIQKIANMAIQSLSGVSDPPADNADGKQKPDAKQKPLEKTANEAVIEIARKAVETMEAIKEIQEKPNEVVSKVVNKQEIANENANAQSGNVVNPIPIKNRTSQHIPLTVYKQEIANDDANAQPANVVNPIPVKNRTSQHVPLPVYKQEIANDGANAQPGNVVNPVPVKNKTNQHIPLPVQHFNPQPHINDANIGNPPAVQNAIPHPINAGPILNNIANGKVNNIQPDVHQPNMPINNHVPNVEQVAANSNNLQANQPSGNQQTMQNKINEEIEAQKLHSHLPDEPHSYKQGEDLQKGVKLPVPLPLAMNGNNQVKQPQNNAKPEVNKVQNVVNNVQNYAKDNFANNNVPNVINPVPDRQKREVIDCTEKSSLRPEDRKICVTLVDLPSEPRIPKVNENYADELKAVDLNDVLRKSLPVDGYHLRSLKSFDETEKR